MGDSRPDNGAGWPPDDGAGGLPELPPEWGTIVIPDDASELDDEADDIRRELRREARRRRLRTLLGRHRADDQPTLGIPLMIMGIAILTTMISLFVVTWGRIGTPFPTATPSAPDHTTSTTANPAASDSGSAPDSSSTSSPRTGLAQLVLRDESGGPVRLGNLLPAVILLVDACRCPGLVLDVAARAPAGVRVIAVGRSAPTIPSRPANVTALADPDTALPAPDGAGPAGAATLVVNHDGNVVVTLPLLTRASELPKLDATQLT